MTFAREYLQRQLTRWLSVFILPDDDYCEEGPEPSRLERWMKATVKPAGDATRYVVLNGSLHYDQDCQATLEAHAARATPASRLFVIYYSSLWRPLLRLADAAGWRSRSREENWLAPGDVNNLLELAGFEIIRNDARVLCPLPIPWVSDWINRWLAPLPFMRSFCLANVTLARTRPKMTPAVAPSVSIVVPARNEAGHIEDIVRRVPAMGPDDELIFVEGNSTDDTWQKIEEVAAAWQGRTSFRIVTAKQDGKGKGDAVRKGFGMARNEVLMILDADMTVPPEDLPKFYRALTSGMAEFVNGSRLVYPMEDKAMRFLNMLGNKGFALGFTFVLGQIYKDTLCGTKVMWRNDYERLAHCRWFFGDFDPFGDFDLILGAARMGLRTREIAVRYRERVYGETNIDRWRHGWLLLRMWWFAARKIKFV